MALKDILVQVDEKRGHDSRLALAAMLASRNDAHLVGLFVVEPVSFSALTTPGGSDFAAAAAFQAIEQEHRAACLKRGERLAALFRDTADRAGVNSEWRIAEDDIATATALHARYADLAVLGQADPDNPPLGIGVPETVLLGSGRPVLVVPFIGAKNMGQRVLVAWNATREAARAVNDALPLLAQAEKVTVLSVNPARGIGGEGDLPAADIALHLARHGVKAEAAYTVAEEVDVGDIILSRAADLGADLIVMGGYGHSRALEFVLGGATRTLLRHMTVPVLLSH
ncbi:MAG TPA: universal stress protein [Stellaceae bacterium]|nr:universal stress protein [Stellaceae bacterium]